MKTSDRFRQRAKDVRKFRDALADLIAVMEEKSTGFVITTMKPIQGKEAKARDLDAKVSHLSGKATIAAKGYEQTIVVEIPHRGKTPVLAIQGWRYALENPFLVEPEYILSMIGQTIGALEAEADAATAREKTLAGRVAAFVGFPAAVRAAVVAEHPGLGKAAFTTGVIAQIFVAVIGGLLTAAATAGVAVLWKQAVHSSPTPSTQISPTPVVSNSPTVVPSSLTSITPSPPSPTHT